jgi:hypothetical protein
VKVVRGFDSLQAEDYDVWLQSHDIPPPLQSCAAISSVATGQPDQSTNNAAATPTSTHHTLRDVTSSTDRSIMSAHRQLHLVWAAMPPLQRVARWSLVFGVVQHGSHLREL